MPLVIAILVAAVVVLAVVAAVVQGGMRNGARVVITPGAGASRAAELMRQWADEGEVAFARGGDLTALESERWPLDRSSGGMPPLRRGQRAAAAGADALLLDAHDWLSVDPAVFHAAAQAAHAPVDHLLDLAGHAHLDSWAAATAGQQHALAGHVGEFQAMEHLQQVGLAPQMAELSNQQGWDATIGNLHVNFKDYADYHSPGIAQHFAHNPDVPIIVPGDTAHLPMDSLHVGTGDHITAADLAQHKVIALDAWHHADAASAMQAAYEQIDPGLAAQHAGDLLSGGHVLGAAGVLDVSFPVVTALLSGYRELSLLSGGNTDLARAAKNVGLDVGGVAAGGAAGHWAGAAVGMAVAGPPGAIVGAIAGGIAGAIGGKMAAGEVRSQPLRNAIAKYETAHERLIEAAQKADAEAGTSWQATYKDVSDEYTRALSELVSLFDRFAGQKRAGAETASRLTTEQATEALSAARQSAENIEPLRASGDRSSTLPGAARLARWAAVRQLRRDLAAWDRAASDAGSVADFAAVLDLLAAMPGGEDEIARVAATGASVRVDAYAAVAAAAMQTQEGAIGLRTAAQERLTREWETLREEVEEQLRPRQEAMSTAEDGLLKELKAAGKAPAV